MTDTNVSDATENELPASAAGSFDFNREYEDRGRRFRLLCAGMVIFIPLGLFALCYLWAGPIYIGKSAPRKLMGTERKITYTLIISIFISIPAYYIYSFYKETSLSCSNKQVKELTQEIIRDKILKSATTVVSITDIRTGEGYGKNGFTCRAEATIGTDDPKGITYTVEPTDDGSRFYVNVRMQQ